MRWIKIAYVAAGFVLLGVVLKDSDLATVWELVRAVGVLGIAAMVAIYALSFLGDSISWALIMTSLPPTPTWWRRLFLIRMAGEAFNNVVPAAGFAGEPVKAVILKKRYGIGLTEATASLVMARTVNMFALIAFLLIGFAFVMGSADMNAAYRQASAVGLALLGLGTVLLFALQRFRVSSLIAGRFKNAVWAERAAKAFAVVEDMDHRFHTFYSAHPWRLSMALLLAFLNWVLGVVEIYVTFMLLGHPIGWQEAWMIEALVQMVRSAVFFIPLAIGAQEGVFVAVVAAMTGMAPLGLACAAVRRCRELIWIGLGLVVAAVYPTTAR